MYFLEWMESSFKDVENKLQSYGNSLCPETIHADITTDAVFLLDEGKYCFDVSDPFGDGEDGSRFFSKLIVWDNYFLFFSF